MKTKTIQAAFESVGGGATAACGFRASGVAAGIKVSKLPDVGIIVSDAPCSAAGSFTTNTARAACVDRNSALLPAKAIRAICCNSGNANACTGKRGAKDADTTGKQLAQHIGARGSDVLVASTGVIGHFLPMDKLSAGIDACAESLSEKGGSAFARAIMTTDLVKKEYAIKVKLGEGEAVIGGCAKGSGMICPTMATMLCFITTDISIECKKLSAILKRVVNYTFNNLTVDGDMSTNDMVLALANGMSGVSVKTARDEKLFEAALFDVCNNLCAKIAQDGEGATKRVEVSVRGAKTYQDCQKAARAIANSNLVKTALFGNDPNWGRILCAIGYSGAQFSPDSIMVRLCGTPVFSGMRPRAFSAALLSKKLRAKLVTIDVDMGMGSNHVALAQTCDLTYDYIKINADYHT